MGKKEEDAMSENTTESTTQNNQGGSQNTEPTEGTENTPAEQTPEPLGEAGKAALQAERKARREAEKFTKDLQDRLAKFEEANQTEAEKLTNRTQQAEERATQYEGRYRDLLTRQAITDEAIKAKTIDPDSVYLHVKDAIEIDDDGNVSGVKKAIDRLVKERPHLFANPAAGARDAVAQSPAAPALNSDALTQALTSKLGIQQ